MEKTYTITITEEELKEIKNDVSLKAMSGKLEFDTTTYIIGKAIHNQIINKEKNKK
jgi:hypothetical protein|tara:strand:- start:361 stop:528 length:168 start_codon:yes stop_codon:yes gene_type:complete